MDQLAFANAYVGRATELDTMRTLLAQVRDGQARAVMISGAAGIGKTALIEQFLHGESDVRVLRTTGERWEALVPYGVVDQLMRVAGVGGARLMASRDDALPGEEPVSVGAWVLEVLARLEQQTPVVVVVDDAHWADTDSLWSILFAARRLVTERVLLVFAAREENVSRLPEGLQRLAAGPSGAVVPLGTLEVEDLRTATVHRSSTGAGPHWKQKIPNRYAHPKHRLSL